VNSIEARPERDRASVGFPPWPVHDEAEVLAAASVLRSGRTNQWTGPEVGHFEETFARWLGTRHALAVSNGSVAVEVCLRSLEIGPGDEVLVPARSYVATALAPGLVGASATLVDADALSGNVTVETLERARTPRTTAAIVAHVAGWPCDMPAIMGWASSNGIRVIEDCAQAQGGMIGDRLVGSFGDAAAFSFSHGKIMSLGGEGGAVCTSDPQVFDRAWSWREHGKANLQHPIDRPNRRLGSNLRMLGLQAAIGLEQLQKLPEWSQKRRANAQALLDALSLCDDIDVPYPADPQAHAAFMLACTLRRGNRDAVVSALVPTFPIKRGAALDVPTSAPWCAVNGLGSTPVAADLAARGMLLPVHPTAGEGDMRRLAEAVVGAVQDHA
jgi:dTDP-4-amino-4,6-dideoxygalactose transaminase